MSEGRTMKRLITAVAAAVLMAGCQSDPMGTTSASLAGQWVRTSGVVGSQLTLQLDDYAAPSVTGMGVYMIEAGKSGTFRVTGTVNGLAVKLDLAFDDGTQAHFTGKRAAADLLDGGLKYGPINGDQPEQAVSFQKAANMMMDPMDPMDGGMMMNMRQSR
jgi:hypothetical protein